MTKKSAKDMKDKAKLEGDMKKMEEAALKAYMNDIEANPDYTSQQIKEKLKEKGVELPPPKPVKPSPPPPPVKVRKVWYEAQSEQGYTYYWNADTNESIWEAPAEGYVTLAEQKQEAEMKQKIEQSKLAEKNEELRSWKAREAMKKFRVEPEPKKSTISTGAALDEPGEQSSFGPTPKPQPYGQWTTVERREELPAVDLQLPETKKLEIFVPVVSEPRIKIKEKKINSLCEEGEENIKQEPTVFKKRKPNPNRGNIRQRFDDD
ncbi:hypothetical protein O3M35_007948 [Rhynocoris fuscipes]|uniref:WW domain-containing protein n=1 Tax=Rhynocoris fuscipes TaxID=488301 RepID=A0AAW1DGF7_9HEMI